MTADFVCFTLSQGSPNKGAGNEHGRSLLAFELRGDLERLIDEAHLLDNSASRQPPDLPFADLVHRFVALNGSQCAIHAAKSQTRRDTPFYEAVILFEHVVKLNCNSLNLTCRASHSRLISSDTSNQYAKVGAP